MQLELLVKSLEKKVALLKKAGLVTTKLLVQLKLLDFHKGLYSAKLAALVQLEALLVKQVKKVESQLLLELLALKEVKKEAQQVVVLLYLERLVEKLVQLVRVLLAKKEELLEELQFLRRKEELVGF